MPTPITKNDWRKLRILGKAKDLAFADLDKDDQRMYITEAEKAINKADRRMYGSEFDLILGQLPTTKVVGL